MPAANQQPAQQRDAPEMIRGHDSPELFRRDTLRRIRSLEDEIVEQGTRIEAIERRINGRS
jgi:hypothetical protein